jgi:hypothetical protein
VKIRDPEDVLDIIITAFQATEGETDLDVIVAAFRRIADHIEASGHDDGTLMQLFEDVAVRIENTSEGNESPG